MSAKNPFFESMKPTLFLILFACGLLGAYSGIGYGKPPLFEILWMGMVMLAIFFPIRFIKAFCLLGCVFCTTLYLSHTRLRVYQKAVEILPKGKAIWEGLVLDAKDHLSGHQSALVHITGLITAHSRQKADWDIQLALYEQASLTLLRPGNTIRFQAKAKPFQKRLFAGDFEGYWYGFSRGIHARMAISNPHQLLVFRQSPHPFLLAHFKWQAKQKLLQMLTPKEASLVFAIVFGETSLFSEEDSELYRSIGAWHLLAVSGLQVSLLALVLWLLFRSLFVIFPCFKVQVRAPFIAAFLSSISVWFYIGLCGFPPSAMRAGLMSSTLFLSLMLRHHISLIDAFGFAGICTLVIWPESIVDVSFLLSYSCVFGLLLVQNASFPIAAPYPLLHLLLRGALASIAAGLVSIPIAAFWFGEINLSGLLSNILLVPTATLVQVPTLVLAFLAICFSSETLAFFSAQSVALMESLCEGFSQYIGHITPIPIPGVWQTVFCWISACLFVLFLTWRKPSFAGLSFALLFLGFSPFGMQEQGVRISFLSVGHGDAAVIQTPSGHVLLVDAGNQSPYKDMGLSVVVPFLKRQGIQHIDVAILTHPDRDHLGGLFSIGKQIPIHSLWHSGLDKHPALQNLKNEMPQTTFQNQQAPKNIHFGDVQIAILWPRSLNPNQSENNNSLVFRLCYQNRCALFTGDIEQESEQQLLQAAYPLLRSDVVKIPHHGSKTSSTDAFIHAAQPKHAIVSTAFENRFGFPHKSVVKRWRKQGTTIWHTGLHGEITVWLNKKGVHIASFQETNAMR